MTPAEVVETALAANLGSVPLSLAAVYAILGDKFIRPAVDRADTVTSKLRGEVSVILADAARPFTSVENATVARISLIGVTGDPLERADISRAPSVDSEGFREAIRTCLDTRSASFDDYWRSVAINRKMRLLFSSIRLMLCVWPILAIIGSVYFGLIKNGVTQAPAMHWLLSTAIFTLLPLLAFVCMIPLMSYYTNCIDRLEH